MKPRCIPWAAMAVASALLVLSTITAVPNSPPMDGGDKAKSVPPDLVKKIERVVPRKGREGGTAWFHPLGNFHTVAVSPFESWVTTGETIPNRSYRGDLLLARILWTKPNRLVSIPQ